MLHDILVPVRQILVKTFSFCPPSSWSLNYYTPPVEHCIENFFYLHAIPQRLEFQIITMSRKEPPYRSPYNFQWPVPVAPPAAIADPVTKRRVQRLTDYFDFYWKRQLDEWKRQDGKGARELKYRTMQVPRVRKVPRNPAGMPVGGIPLTTTVERNRYGGAPKQAKNEWMNEVTNGAFGVNNYTMPLKLQFRKVLGKGGQGVAALFELTLPGGEKDQLVVKASTRSDDLKAEVANVRASRGAPT